MIFFIISVQIKTNDACFYMCHFHVCAFALITNMFRNRLFT